MSNCFCNPLQAFPAFKLSNPFLLPVFVVFIVFYCCCFCCFCCRCCFCKISGNISTDCIIGHISSLCVGDKKRLELCIGYTITCTGISLHGYTGGAEFDTLGRLMARAKRADKSKGVGGGQIGTLTLTRGDGCVSV